MTQLTRTAAIDTATSGDTTIIEAPPSGRIRVYAYTIVAAGAVNARWKSGANNKSGALPLAANGGVAPEGGGHPVIVCNTGEALVLNLSGAVQVSGHVSYSTGV